MTVKALQAKAAPSSQYRFVAKGKAATIYLYGIIDSMAGFFGDGVTAKMIADDLKKAGTVENIDLRINSPGGDVFEGRAIYTLLGQHPAKITVHVDAEASSAASLIAMAGDDILMAEGSIMMIHCAWSGFRGNADEMQKHVDLLRMVDQTLVESYAAKTKQDPKEILKWMKAETYMTAKEAVDLGFATAVSAPIKVAAMAFDRKALGYQKEPPAQLMPNRLRAAAALERIRAI